MGLALISSGLVVLEMLKSVVVPAVASVLNGAYAGLAVLLVKYIASTTRELPADVAISRTLI